MPWGFCAIALFFAEVLPAAHKFSINAKKPWQVSCVKEKCTASWLTADNRSVSVDFPWTILEDKVYAVGLSRNFQYLGVITGSDTNRVVALPRTGDLSKIMIIEMVIGSAPKDDVFLVQTQLNHHYNSDSDAKHPNILKIIVAGSKEIEVPLSDLECESAFLHYCIFNFRYVKGRVHFEWRKPFSSKVIRVIKVSLF